MPSMSCALWQGKGCWDGCKLWEVSLLTVFSVGLKYWLSASAICFISFFEACFNLFITNNSNWCPIFQLLHWFIIFLYISDRRNKIDNSCFLLFLCWWSYFFCRLVAESNGEKRMKNQKAKSKLSEARKQLSDVRVIQRNLVYIVGLPLNLADESVNFLPSVLNYCYYIWVLSSFYIFLTVFIIIYAASSAAGLLW